MDKIAIFGSHESNTLAQLQDVASRAERAALMADGHLGYVMPIGGVAAYRDHVSVVGVGFDIACGNAAIRTGLTVEDVTKGLALDEIRRNPHRLITDRRANRVADEVAQTISFGLGRRNNADDAPVDDPLFSDPAWYAIPNTGGYRDTCATRRGGSWAPWGGATTTWTCSPTSAAPCGWACTLGAAASGTPWPATSCRCRRAATGGSAGARRRCCWTCASPWATTTGT